jgi:hypothetical protein
VSAHRRYRVPGTEALVAGLTSALADTNYPAAGLAILDRRFNPYSATHATEILECRLGDGRELRALGKYGSAHRGSGRGARGGLLYEASVYREVLRRQRCPVPDFYGTYVHQEEAWLFLEHLGELLRISKVGEDAMRRAARWLGRFHASTVLPSGNATLTFLKRYDADYYAGWAERTARFAGHLARQAPWVAPLCAAFQERIPALLSAPQAVIHGEFVMENVLFRDGIVYPIDWESAAIGPGEIDLAALTDLWSNDIASMCEQEYERARWPEGAPAAFPETLANARLYWPLRWLGDRASWTRRGNRYFPVLQRAGQRLGLA